MDAWIEEQREIANQEFEKDWPQIDWLNPENMGTFAVRRADFVKGYLAATEASRQRINELEVIAANYADVMGKQAAELQSLRQAIEQAEPVATIIGSEKYSMTGEKPISRWQLITNMQAKVGKEVKLYTHPFIKE